MRTTKKGNQGGRLPICMKIHFHLVVKNKDTCVQRASWAIIAECVNVLP